MIEIIGLNFVKNILESDKELFFGPVIKSDIFIDIEENDIMAHLMFKAKIFKSVSEARKNGWNKPIPFGFNIFTVGKNKKQIFVLNIKPELE